jgi:hypothetical protein
MRKSPPPVSEERAAKDAALDDMYGANVNVFVLTFGKLFRRRSQERPSPFTAVKGKENPKITLEDYDREKVPSVRLGITG